VVVVVLAGLIVVVVVVLAGLDVVVVVEVNVADFKTNPCSQFWQLGHWNPFVPTLTHEPTLQGFGSHGFPKSLFKWSFDKLLLK